jgi:hypothetical protein
MIEQALELGSRIAVIDNCQKATVAVISDLANKLLREREKPKASSAQTDDPIDKLERLAVLHASGSLTDAEFGAAKAKLLGI